jgi:hypothetical protein
MRLSSGYRQHHPGRRIKVCRGRLGQFRLHGRAANCPLEFGDPRPKIFIFVCRRTLGVNELHNLFGKCDALLGLNTLQLR